jgi:hypothetical protein
MLYTASAIYTYHHIPHTCGYPTFLDERLSAHPASYNQRSNKTPSTTSHTVPDLELGLLITRRKLLLHSSYARPAPNPSPTRAGHARRLKRRTEKTTPKERPIEDRIRSEARQWSHCPQSYVSHFT